MSYYNEKADQVSDTHTYTDSVDTLGMNLGIYEANGIPFPLYGFTSSVIEPFGVTHARPAVARSDVQPR